MLQLDDKTFLSMLQISDSVFPIGGFSHSLGLEAYLQHYGMHIAGQRDLFHIFVCILENAGSFAVPFVRAAHGAGRNGTDLAGLDKLCQACTANHVACKASIRQGKALVEASSMVFDSIPADRKKICGGLPHGHFPVVYGSILDAIGLDLCTTLLSFMFGMARNLVATSVRLDVIGAMEGQKIQSQLQDMIPDILTRNMWRDTDDACIKCPLPDILQNTHDTFFCKLFYS